MGQANQRGTKEERCAKGKIKREIELAHVEAIEEYWKRIQKANRVKFNGTETGRTSCLTVCPSIIGLLYTANDPGLI